MFKIRKVTTQDCKFETFLFKRQSSKEHLKKNKINNFPLVFETKK